MSDDDLNALRELVAEGAMTPADALKEYREQTGQSLSNAQGIFRWLQAAKLTTAPHTADETRVDGEKR